MLLLQEEKELSDSAVTLCFVIVCHKQYRFYSSVYNIHYLYSITTFIIVYCSIAVLFFISYQRICA